LRDTGGDLAVVLRAISEAKAKTDRLDARRLAELLAAGYLAEVWCPDERTRALRRFVARRAQLVRQRSRAKIEIAAALQRNLLDRPGLYDVAGTKAGSPSRASSSQTTSATPSWAACARSTSSTTSWHWSTARSPRPRSIAPRCAG
jgi:Transposase